jgi:hypothetical protein
VREAVVDLLEVVDVEQRDDQGMPGDLAQAAVEVAPVPQSRQRVGVGESLDGSAPAPLGADPLSRP